MKTKNKKTFPRRYKALAAMALFFLLSLLEACSAQKKELTANQPVTDPVCKMKIKDSSEAYSKKYKGKTYFFDSNTCKDAFKMNPENFLNNVCTPIK